MAGYERRSADVARHVRVGHYAEHDGQPPPVMYAGLRAPAARRRSVPTGAIDASEWIGPWLAMVIHEVANYYYYPGWHVARME